MQCEYGSDITILLFQNISREFPVIEKTFFCLFCFKAIFIQFMFKIQDKRKIPQEIRKCQWYVQQYSLHKSQQYQHLHNWIAFYLPFICQHFQNNGTSIAHFRHVSQYFSASFSFAFILIIVTCITTSMYLADVFVPFTMFNTANLNPPTLNDYIHLLWAILFLKFRQDAIGRKKN